MMAFVKYKTLFPDRPASLLMIPRTQLQRTNAFIKVSSTIELFSWSRRRLVQGFEEMHKTIETVYEGHRPNCLIFGPI